MSQNRPTMPQKRPKIWTPPQPGCVCSVATPQHTWSAEVTCLVVFAPSLPCSSCRSRSRASPVPMPLAPATAAILKTATPATNGCSTDELRERVGHLAQLGGLLHGLGRHVRFPRHRLLAIPQPRQDPLDPELDFVQPRGTRNLERLLHDRLGATETPEP